MTMTRLSMAAAALLASALPALAQTPAGPSPSPPSTSSPAPTPPPAQILAPSAAKTEMRTLTTPDGKSLAYALVTPPGFIGGQGGNTYPVLLALPPGAQDQAMVRTGLSTYWEAEAGRRGWVVVSPVAPAGSTFMTGGETLIPALLAEVARLITAEEGKVHLAGVSTGGRSAFRIAALYPASFASLTVLPGVPPEERDYKGLAALRPVPVTLFVGDRDSAEWVQGSKRAERELKKAGVAATLEVVKGQGHTLKLDPARLFDTLENYRPARTGGVKPPPSLQPAVTPTQPAGVTPATGPQPAAPAIGPMPSPTTTAAAVKEVGAALDDLHAAAAAADEARYFARFAPGAVFLGTDPAERWTVDEFRAYAHPLFAKGQGWAYTPRDRHMTIAADGRTAWFDEKLDNDKYGECRGTGVLVRSAPLVPATTTAPAPAGGDWKLTQYNLTKPIPNDLMKKVTGLVKDETKKRLFR